MDPMLMEFYAEAALPLLALVAGIVLAWAFYDWEEPL